MAYQRVTLTTLQARLADRYDGTVFWTGAEATSAINESMRVWNGLTGYWRQRITLTGSPNDPWLPIPGSLVQGARLEFGGIALQRVSLAHLQYGRAYWQSETSATIKVWAPVGLSLVALWPAPLANATITVDGIASTPVLVNGGDFVDIGDEEIGILLGFALHLLTFKGPDALFAGTAPLRQAFYTAAALRNERFSTSDFLRGFLGLNKERSQFRHKRPSQIQQAVKS